MFGLKGYSLFNFLNFICNIIYTVERDACPCRHLIMVMKVGAWRKVDFFFSFILISAEKVESWGKREDYSLMSNYITTLAPRVEGWSSGDVLGTPMWVRVS